VEFSSSFFFLLLRQIVAIFPNLIKSSKRLKIKRSPEQIEVIHVAMEFVETVTMHKSKNYKEFKISVEWIFNR
jgi:hypothetical protein